MKKCVKCGNPLSDTAKFCGSCGTSQPAVTPCPNCGAALASPTAKFCGSCGKPVAAAVPQVVPCPNCGAALASPTAKFCGSCGKPVSLSSQANNVQQSVTAQPSAQQVSSNASQTSLVASFVHWNILQGQIAAKIDELTINGYGSKVKGLSVQDGVTALFFVSGKMVAELPGGGYEFKEFDDRGAAKSLSTAEKVVGAVGSFIRGIASHVPGLRNLVGRGSNSSAGTSVDNAFSAVLIRENRFPLIFDLKNIDTANIRSDVGLHILCQINDFDEFYRNCLLDNAYVSYDGFNKVLESSVRDIVNEALQNVSPENVKSNAQLKASILQQLKVAVAELYPFIDVTNVVSISASNEDLNKIRRLREELYVAELELEQLKKRNDFTNRLQSEEIQQYIRELELDAKKRQGEVDLEAVVNKIDEQHLLNDDEKAKFVMMLRAERTLREAKSDDEVQAGLHEFEKSGMLREEEIENLRHNIMQRSDLRDLKDGQILVMTTLHNDVEYAREKMNWEFELGQKTLENELQLRRTQDAYDDDRRVKDAAFADERRTKNYAFEKQVADDEEARKAREEERFKERMRMAQAMRNEREGTFADRAAYELNMASLKGQQENALFQGRSAEEIMALKGNLSSEAIAAKYTAQAEVAQNGKLEEKNQQMFDMMEKMLNKSDAEKENQKDLMLQMMGMMNANNQANNNQSQANMNQMLQMFAQMGMTGMQAAAGAQANATASKFAAQDAQVQFANEKADIYKQRATEIRSDSNADEDRMLKGMQTSVQAVAGAMRPTGSRQQRKDMGSAEEGSVNSGVCPRCGADMSGQFCTECGYPNG